MTPNQPTTLEQVIEEVRSLKARTTSDRLWDGVMKAMVPIMILVVGWGIMLEVRVSVIESHLDREFPPAWLKEDIQEIKERLKALEHKRP